MAEQLTDKDVARIQAEIEHRRLVVRPQCLEAVKEARAQGDLSENFEYYAAKREKNKNESRIRYLEKVLRYATVIEDHSEEDEIGLENTVTIRFEDDDMLETYRIVTPIRCNSLQNKISIESPIGKALLGHKKGDRVEVMMPNGSSYFLIIEEVEKTEDDGTDKIRSY